MAKLAVGLISNAVELGFERRCRFLLVIGVGIGISMVLPARGDAAVVTAKSVSLSDVTSAVSSAHDGDTVLVPAGTASWTSTLEITKAITIEGAGNDKTVILDDLSREEHGEGSREGGQRERGQRDWRAQQQRQQQQQQPSEQERAQRQWRAQQQQQMGERQREWRTQQQPSEQERAQMQQRTQQQQQPGEQERAQMAHRAGGASRGLVAANLNPNHFFRLTGCTFRYGSVTTRPQSGGCIIIKGTCPSVRVDHCHFDQLYQAGILFQGWIYGVIDHNLWDVRAGAGTIPSMTVNNGATWGGGSNNYGDGSWAAPTNFGSEKFLFIENNTINNLGTGQVGGIIDCQDGGRYVSRFNTFKNTTMISGHGTETGGRQRGQRAIEFYNNTETTTVPQGIGITRSGTVLYHHNTWTGPIMSPRIPLVVFRELWPYRWGGANGLNPWDVNDTEGNGTNVPGHSPHLYASGKHTGANGSSGTLVSAGARWQPNQWVGYMLTNMTQTTRWGDHHCSSIKSNTSDTIVYNTRTPDGQPKTFNTGDNFVIYKVLVALDQPGRGKGDLLANNPAINTKTGGIAWPHEALEPIYSWGNTLNGSLVRAESNFTTLRENRDYYNQAASFDGTAGVGVGPVADRPSTCTPGVAYWATDQGEWDSTHEGPDGQLYVCTAANSWSLYYKPYTYPHPLVSGWPPPHSDKGSKGGRDLMGE